MPAKFQLHTHPVPPRHRPIGKLGIVDWREDCAGCHNCVKKACVYGLYRDEADTLHDELGYLDYIYQCKGCLSCVQNCTKGILTRVVNPEYKRLGDAHYTPDIVLTTWFQAETGRIPVSGSGYGGPFSGPGFDSMWTDMSEIVRPTRDGIHGREYINTGIDIGRKLHHLAFEDGQPTVEAPPLVTIPMPVMFEVIPARWRRGQVAAAAIGAAERIGLLAVAPAGEAPEDAVGRGTVVPLLDDRQCDEAFATARMVMIPDGGDAAARRAALKVRNPAQVVVIRLEASPDAAKRVEALVRDGAEAIHLVFDSHGLERAAAQPRHMRDVLREVHLALVKSGTRDLVTLVASGGIALAEHVTKAMLCGADLVAVDVPLVLALECRLCGECERGQPCPAALDDADAGYAMHRMVNLMSAWHQQLIEMMGAMGIREARRLRGEVGRCMFFEDLERDTFGRLFGKRKETVGAQKVVSTQPATTTTTTSAADVARSTLDVPSVSREVRPTPPRYRNEIGKFSVRRSAACVRCGRCVELCPHGVHTRPEGYRFVVRPFDFRCIGPACAKTDHYCVAACPSGALSVSENPTFETLGDRRWTPDLLASTWVMAETGHAPGPHLESEVGNSGGGFDKLRFRFPAEPTAGLRREDISTKLLLNRRRDDPRPKITIDIPWYGGGMSFGSTNIHMLLGKARAATAWNTFSCTGEGGYPERFIPYADHMITQVATGLFGVREETIQRAPIVEFKYAQGAKPGLGGHLLGDKNTPAVAAMREAVVGTSLFSPFPFHSVYSVEDHKKHLDWIAHVNPRALLSAKVSTPTDVDMVAVGVYYAGAHIVHLDGSYGGTGAAPNVAKKNIAKPIEYAINQVHQFLANEGIRDQVTVMASGGVRSPHDVAKAIALGADGCIIGTAELVAAGCIRCGACESGRGCARGIATTDPQLLEMVAIEWCTQRLINMHNAWRETLVGLLWRLGLDSVSALRGRTDLLRHLDYEDSK